MDEELENKLRAMRLRQPSRELDERVWAELRHERMPAEPRGTNRKSFPAWLAGVSAVAAVVALALSIAAFVRTVPQAQVAPQDIDRGRAAAEARPAQPEEIHPTDTDAPRKQHEKAHPARADARERHAPRDENTSEIWFRMRDEPLPFRRPLENTRRPNDGRWQPVMEDGPPKPAAVGGADPKREQEVQ